MIQWNKLGFSTPLQKAVVLQRHKQNGILVHIIYYCESHQLTLLRTVEQRRSTAPSDGMGYVGLWGYNFLHFRPWNTIIVVIFSYTRTRIYPMLRYLTFLLLTWKSVGCLSCVKYQSISECVINNKYFLVDFAITLHICSSHLHLCLYQNVEGLEINMLRYWTFSTVYR